ncbi:MAG: hypothetical protein KF819_25430 [Labilithrix sp.]|nr:hypothetical protein [Labilithrix sp.]
MPSLRSAVLVASGVVLVASCSSDPRAPGATTSFAPAEARPSASRVEPAVDLQTVVRHAALAFRAEGGALAAAGSTFEAKIAAGRIEMTPRRGATLSLETTLVARGSRVIAGRQPPRAVVERDGTVVLARGEVDEHVANEGDGIEQSWAFARAPSGEGDLVVRVRTAGERHAATTAHGLHFETKGGIGVRYGTATWVDASGKRTVVTPRMVGDEIVMIVPDAVLKASRYPAVLDPTVTPEAEIDAPVSGSSASGEQYSPSVVSAGPGKGYFAVWFDRRGIRPAIYGARIASDGTVIDGSGIAIATGVGSTVPLVSAANDGFLVTWAVSYFDTFQPPGVYGVRLDAQGTPLDTTPLVLAANQTNVEQPSSAFDGTSWFVAWQRYGGPSSWDIAGVRVPRTGAVLDATPIEVSKLPEAEYQPIVRWDGASHFVMWRSFNTLYGRKFGTDGKPTTARLTLAASSGSSVYSYQSAFDGTQHLLVWSDYGTGSMDIFARRINLAGAPIDPANIVVSSDPFYEDRPRAAWDGASFVVTWSRSGQLMGRRVSSAGGLPDGAPIALATGGSWYDSNLASDGLGSLAVAQQYNAGLASSDVAGVKLAKPPAPSTTFVVSKAANSQTEPVTAWNGSNHVSVWIDTRDGRAALYGALLSPDGQPGATSQIVSDVRYASGLGRARIATDGASYLVVFNAYDTTTSKYGIRGIHLDATGKPEGSVFDVYVPASTSEYTNEPDVAFDGTNYLVVWENQTSEGGGQTGIAGIRLARTATTALDNEPLRITSSTPVEARLLPSIAYDGKSYLVAWMTSRPAAGGNIEVSHIFATRVSKEGTVLDGEQVVCDAFLFQRAPQVAADVQNGGFMVVWEDYRTALEASDVYGARITSDGQNLDGTSGMKIAVGAHDESRPRVARSGDGTNWVVAWRDLRGKQSYDLYGAWISKAGKNHDPAGLLLSAEPGDEDAPWLSPSVDGKLLVTYQRLDPRTGYGSYRIRARAIAGGAKVGATCAKDDDCASRSCVDGVCCSTECGGCGVCNVEPGTCTPRAAGAEASSCPGYKCKGTLECPAKCENDDDCASNATCDPATKTCVSRVICISDTSLKDLTGKVTDCTPFKCTADACRAQCGSVDDCAPGFVCDYGGRCVQGPGENDGGCASAGSTGSSPGGWLLVGTVCVAAFAGLRRRRA